MKVKPQASHAFARLAHGLFSANERFVFAGMSEWLM
jgi:hypothetical protein